MSYWTGVSVLIRTLIRTLDRTVSNLCLGLGEVYAGSNSWTDSNAVKYHCHFRAEECLHRFDIEELGEDT